MTNIDWTAWHEAYTRPGSALADRLAVVRSHIARRLDADRVTALLVEYDAGLVARARDAAASHFDTADDHVWSVGVHRLVADPQPLEPGRHWFTFDRG